MTVRARDSCYLKMLLEHPEPDVKRKNKQGMHPLNIDIQRQVSKCDELLRQAGARELPEFRPAH